MKLLFTHTSPFARKCRVVAQEADITGKIEEVIASPVDPNSGVASANPLAKIPALIRDDGSTLYDSPVICEYLDSLGKGTMFPDVGESRWQALRRQALADGLMDAAILRRYEAARPESQRSADWEKRQQTKIEAGLDSLESDTLPSVADIGTITVAIALDYLDFRFAAEAWRNRRPRLASWHRAFSQRRSLQSTMPRE